MVKQSNTCALKRPTGKSCAGIQPPAVLSPEKRPRSHRGNKNAHPLAPETPEKRPKVQRALNMPKPAKITNQDKAPCIRCKKKSKPAQLLMCDGDGCSNVCHMSCEVPILTEVPEGDYFCLPCREVRGHVFSGMYR